MRLIIPNEIKKMQEKFAPYMHYIKGQGMVLDSAAPSEIVEMKQKVSKWFEDHDRAKY